MLHTETLHFNVFIVTSTVIKRIAAFTEVVQYICGVQDGNPGTVMPTYTKRIFYYKIQTDIHINIQDITIMRQSRNSCLSFNTVYVCCTINVICIICNECKICYMYVYVYLSIMLFSFM